MSNKGGPNIAVFLSTKSPAPVLNCFPVAYRSCISVHLQSCCQMWLNLANGFQSYQADRHTDMHTHPATQHRLMSQISIRKETYGKQHDQLPLDHTPGVKHWSAPTWKTRLCQEPSNRQPHSPHLAVRHAVPKAECFPLSLFKEESRGVIDFPFLSYPAKPVWQNKTGRARYMCGFLLYLWHRLNFRGCVLEAFSALWRNVGTSERQFGCYMN